MDQETKIKLAYRAAIVSGIFCGVVSLLLLLNFWHMKQHEPLESATIEALVSRLAQEPNNEELKQEIRSFDLLARKAYFTSRWQIKTGTYLLLFGGILLAISLKIYTDLRARIGPPEAITEDLLKARANAQYWMFLTGGLVLGLALTSAFLSNDYLREYEQMAVNQEPAETGSDIEVIEVFPADNPVLAGDPVQGSDSLLSSVNQQSEGQSETQVAVATEQPASESAQPVSSSVVYGIKNFKENHGTFRGYLGQGVSYHKNIPVNWNGSSGENIKWKVAFSKPGYNSPVIWGDKLFISGGDSQVRIVTCYNRLE